MPTLIGVFTNRSQAERAVAEVRSEKISSERISVVAREGYIHGDDNDTNDSFVSRVKSNEADDGETQYLGNGERQNLSAGVTTGGTLGGITGLLAGAGLLTIPGLGPILALGPIVAGLTGATVGSVAGSLVDLGIAPERSQYYEAEVERGGIIAAVECEQQQINNVAAIFRENGARDIETH